MLEGLPGDDKRWKITQCPGRAVGPLPLLKLLSAPLTLQSAGLTPGRVFCSCRALWAFRAESRAQYVRKAHPEETQAESQGWGEPPVSPS